MILETERLLLREIRSSDYLALCDILQDIDVMYAWEHAFSDTMVKIFINENRLNYRKHGYSYLAVLKKDTNQLVGVAGLLPEEVQFEEHLGIGYIFRKDVWGNGYATECSEALLVYAFETLEADEVTAQIRPTNRSSRRVAEKLGLHVQKEFIREYRGKEVPHLFYAIAAQEWRQK